MAPFSRAAREQPVATDFWRVRMRHVSSEDSEMAFRAVRSWAEYRRALVIVTLVFLVIAVWGIWTSEAGDHSTQYGMIAGCGLLVIVLVIGELAQLRKKRQSDTQQSSSSD
jgi:hypothetical protein